jgi:hypothetical protein
VPLLAAGVSHMAQRFRLPSPLWGGVGGGGRGMGHFRASTSRPPTPTLPHKGGGSRSAVPFAIGLLLVGVAGTDPRIKSGDGDDDSNPSKSALSAYFGADIGAAAGRQS